MSQPFSFCRFRKESWDARISGFLAAVHSQEPVTGLTHNFYRYPARFSPQFARAAIEVFSEPGDVVLDPFMGSGTTLVEASALGRLAGQRHQRVGGLPRSGKDNAFK